MASFAIRALPARTLKTPLMLRAISGGPISIRWKWRPQRAFCMALELGVPLLLCPSTVKNSVKISFRMWICNHLAHQICSMMGWRRTPRRILALQVLHHWPICYLATKRISLCQSLQSRLDCKVSFHMPRCRVRFNQGSFLVAEEAVNILPGLNSQPQATDFDTGGMAVWTSVPNGYE